MKMYEIIELSNLYNSIKDYKMPLRTAYKFTLLMKKVEVEMQFYHSELSKIISNFAKKDSNGNYMFTEDGSSIVIIPGKEAECNTQLAELRNLEVNIDNIKFTISELESFDLTIAQLSCLMSLIE